MNYFFNETKGVIAIDKKGAVYEFTPLAGLPVMGGVQEKTEEPASTPPSAAKKGKKNKGGRPKKPKPEDDEEEDAAPANSQVTGKQRTGAIRMLLTAGKSVKEIAEKLNCTEANVYYQKSILDKEKGAEEYPSELIRDFGRSLVEKVATRKDQGMNEQEIADELEESLASVEEIFVKLS